jgi:hypothetical protein
MSIPRIPARRYPAGVDRRFDDLIGASDEFIRLARRGHVFVPAALTISEDAEHPRRHADSFSEPWG